MDRPHQAFPNPALFAAVLRASDRWIEILQPMLESRGLAVSIAPSRRRLAELLQSSESRLVLVEESFGEEIVGLPAEPVLLVERARGIPPPPFFDILELTDDRELLGARLDLVLGRAAEAEERRASERLQRLLEKALETTQLGITVTDTEGSILYSNPAEARMHGYRQDELIGSDVAVFSGAARRRPLTDDELREMRSWRRDAFNRRRDGSTFPTRLLSDVVLDAGGEPIGVVTTCENLSAQREAETTRLFLSKAIETMQLGITLTDLEGRILYTNPADAAIHGYPAEQLPGRDVRIFAPQERWRPMSKEQIRAMNRWRRESVNVRQDGSTFPVLLHSDVLLGPAGEPLGIVTTCEDITEHKQIEERLHFAARRDALTGLINRDVLVDRLLAAMSRHNGDNRRGFSVLFVDIDRFKVVNDSLGHLRGDRLLVEIAARLGSVVGEGDTVARLGGDEFAILLDAPLDEAHPETVAHQVQVALRPPFEIAERKVHLTASVGIVRAHARYQRPEEYLRDADTAMYRAKAEGRARHRTFDHSMHRLALSRLETEEQLRNALDRQELRLHYQPIVSLADSRITGFEALVRWQHPGRGLVGPAEFVHLAEEAGLADDLARWVLTTACRQLAHWKRDPELASDLFLSVNLSPQRFSNPGTAQMVLECSRATGLDPTALRIEITESALMEDPTTSAEVLRRLRGQGIRLYLDDFGTGYSSLSHLHRFPIDGLKIDRSFVARIDSDPGPVGIVRSIVALARELELDTVAEGLETAPQVSRLRELGCSLGQGFFYARPLETGAADSLLRQSRPF